MARAAAGPPPIRFRGVPASLTAVVAGGMDPLSDPVLVLKGYPKKGGSTEVPVQVDMDPRILRMSLPADVAPGAYEALLRVASANGGAAQAEKPKGSGTARKAEAKSKAGIKAGDPEGGAGETELPARVEVDAAPVLRVIPEQLRLRAHPGDLVGTDLTLLNQGNVPVDLRRVQPFGIFLAGGLERALRRAYVDKLSKGERRVDVIADNLAEAHGGLVKMKLQKGYGTLAPGEMRSLEVTLEIPAGLAAGSTYAGNWELAGLVYPVTLTVEGAPPAPPEDEQPENPEKPEKPR
jgi:hypothetical protein